MIARRTECVKASVHRDKSDITPTGGTGFWWSPVVEWPLKKTGPVPLKEAAVDIDQAIKGRRSVRRYKTDPVDEKTVETVLDAARWAPSWANTQSWRFVVVRDKETKSKLAGTLVGVGGGRPNRAAEGLMAAPVAIAVCAQFGQAGFSHGDEQPRAITNKGDYWYMFDAGLVTQTLCLAAHAHGLGTVIIGAFDSKAAGEVLEVPDGFTVVALTPLGHPDETPAVRPRRELTEILYRERFGRK